MIHYGDVGGYSAMAKTVAIPAAIGGHLLLQGKVSTYGVISPMLPEIYNPCLAILEQNGIYFKCE